MKSGSGCGVGRESGGGWVGGVQQSRGPPGSCVGVGVGESGSGGGSGWSDEKNVVWGVCLGAVGGAERGVHAGGEMKSLKKDEEKERAEHT